MTALRHCPRQRISMTPSSDCIVANRRAHAAERAGVGAAGRGPLRADRATASRCQSLPARSQEIRFDSERSRHLFLLGRDRDPERCRHPAASRHPAWRRDRRRSARGIAGGQGVRDLDLRRASRAGQAQVDRTSTFSPSTARRGRTPRSCITKSAIGCVGGIINLAIAWARDAPARLLLRGRSHGRYRRRTAARARPATHGGHRIHCSLADVRDVMDTGTSRGIGCFTAT